MAIRSFLAFELPNNISAEIKRISTEVKKTGLNAGWVKPGNIHLTVIFMGDVDEKDNPHIISSIDKVVCQYKPFDIPFSNHNPEFNYNELVTLEVTNLDIYF